MEAFRLIFKDKFPKLSKHFANLQVDVGMFVTQWFMCLFINMLPTEVRQHSVSNYPFFGVFLTRMIFLGCDEIFGYVFLRRRKVYI